MKVLFCDPLNTQNNFYVYSRYLREYGIDAHVVMDKTRVPLDARPGWHDSKEVEWVHYFDLPYFIPWTNPLKYLSQQRELVDFAKGFDLIVCSGLAPLWIQFVGKPWVFFSYGSDLDQVAVHGWSGNSDQKFNMYQQITNFAVSELLKDALRKARATVIAPYQKRTAEKIGLQNLVYLPHIIDVDTFKPFEDRESDRQAAHEKYDCDFIMFHPPRQAWADSTLADCKGNDKVFRAFSQFAGIYKGKAKLLVAKKGWDVEYSERYIDELGIRDKVVWIEPVPKAEMRRLYNVSDIVLDQFVVGVLALVAIEGMACGSPVMSYVTNDTKELYPEMPPIINVRTEDEILRGMCFLAGSQERRQQIGQRGREWVLRNCSPGASVPHHIKFLRSVID